MTAHLAEADRRGVIALAALPGLGPRRLRTFLDHHAPSDAWSRLRAGGALAPHAVATMPPTALAALYAQAGDLDADALVARCDQLSVSVLVAGDEHYPEPLAVDDDRPAVLFARGRFDVLRQRRVGIVGTRNATAAGRATAFELGARLAAAGVSVVSGLARGIDGAAHRGVRSVDGSPVAVVGSGIDVPYPRQHLDLWTWVVDRGLLLSEWPPGVQADAWHFPLRNRIIAVLSEVLVVVESRETGGSLITAKQANDRGITVMAVPGSPRSRAATGTNTLLSQGAIVVTSVDDVLLALGLDHSRAAGNVTPSARVARSPRAPGGTRPDTLEGRLFALCADRPCTLDDAVVELGVSVHEAAMAAARLERDGWLIDTAGWLEPAGSKLWMP